MKISNYIILYLFLLINNIFAISLGGRVIIEGWDPYFNFADKSITITDASNTFGSVVVSSTGDFTFPKVVTDNKPHGYSITINETPNNDSFLCSISDNQVTGMVYLKDKTDLTIACRGKYYAKLSVTGLTPQDSLTATGYQNGTLTFTSTSASTQTFSNWFYNNYVNYYLNSIKYNFTYSETNYRRCVNQNIGVTNNYFNISVNCFDSSFSLVTLAVPSAREGSVGWTDSSGNYYLFGGYDVTGYKQDLWVLIGSGSGSWVELKPSTITQPWPIARFGSVGWTDIDGNNYLFGGEIGTNSYLKDLWKLTVSGNTVTWVNLTPATIPPSWPSARVTSVAWTDSSGNKYLFGGAIGTNSYLNDLWKLTVSSDNTPTWVKFTSNSTLPSARGSSVGWAASSSDYYLFGGFNGFFKQDLWKLTVSGDIATWVNLTPADPITVPWPSGRSGVVVWTDNSGNHYLFGGINQVLINNIPTFNNYQDLWKLTVSSNIATWINLTPSDTTLSWPSARSESVGWTDKDGNNYLFGGYEGNSGYDRDLWKLNVSGNTITWVNLTPADPITVTWPSKIANATSWEDNFGNYYLFGGYNSIIPTIKQDLWKLNISGNTVTWVKLPPNSLPSWPSKRISSVAWTDEKGNTYLFGGYNGSYLNDLFIL